MAVSPAAPDSRPISPGWRRLSPKAKSRLPPRCPPRSKRISIRSFRILLGKLLVGEFSRFHPAVRGRDEALGDGVRPRSWDGLPIRLMWDRFVIRLMWDGFAIRRMWAGLAIRMTGS